MKMREREKVKIKVEVFRVREIREREIGD
jgi:hypothetical protein